MVGRSALGYVLVEATGGVFVGGKIQGGGQSEESVRRDFDIVCHLAWLGIFERRGSVLRRVGCLIESPFYVDLLYEASVDFGSLGPVVYLVPLMDCVNQMCDVGWEL